jgi:phosphoenolpyruvate-protein phosphotransferase (PTS system enzyme I)
MIGAKGKRGSGTMQVVDPGSSGGDRPVRPIVLKGIGGSPGLVIGPAVIVGAPESSFARRNVRSHEIDGEVGRFKDAVSRAQDGIRQVVDRVKTAPARAETSILEAYVMMLGDELLAETVERNIRVNRQNAEWAVSNTTKELCAQFEKVTDPYIAERKHDVMFVGERLLRAFTGTDAVDPIPKLNEPSVALAHDLSPADTAAMVKEPVVAFVTEVGTRTSHTSIMARALEIPAVVGVADALGRVGPGDTVIVDGFRGEVTVCPTDEMIADALERADKHNRLIKHLRAGKDKQASTIDGVAVHLRANVEFPAEALLAIDYGAEGVGLYRTEFLYIDRAVPPDEEEQYRIYRDVIETMSPRPVTLRTFDIGGDKFVSTFQVPPEMNPALGLRAVRLALSRPDVFLQQLRAMVRASAHGEMQIMVPMVASLREYQEVKRLLGRAMKEVGARGQKHAKKIPLGVMIEVPGAAVMADMFAREADFLSLGTNDLVQYALAIDRTSRSLAYLASPFDPSVLRLIVNVVAAAERHGKSVSVCGAMASDPLAAILLVGLGFKELSMEASAIPEIKEALRRVTFAEASAVANDALGQESAEDVERTVAAAFAPRLFDLLADVSSDQTP